MRAKNKKISESRARDILKVLRVVDQILHQGVNELSTARLRGTRRLSTTRRGAQAVTVLVP